MKRLGIGLVIGLILTLSFAGCISEHKVLVTKSTDSTLIEYAEFSIGETIVGKTSYHGSFVEDGVRYYKIRRSGVNTYVQRDEDGITKVCTADGCFWIYGTKNNGSVVKVKFIYK